MKECETKRTENVLKRLLQPGIRLFIEFYTKKDDLRPRKTIGGFLVSTNEIIKDHTFVDVVEELGLGSDVCSSFVLEGQPEEGVNKFGQNVLNMGRGIVRFRSNSSIVKDETYERTTVIKFLQHKIK